MSYTDHLLNFTDEAEAIAALPSLRTKSGWAPSVAVVKCRTANAVYGPPELGSIFPTIISPPQYLPGFWLQVAVKNDELLLKQVSQFDHAYNRADGTVTLGIGKSIEDVNQIIHIDGGFFITESQTEKVRVAGSLTAKVDVAEDIKG